MAPSETVTESEGEDAEATSKYHPLNDAGRPLPWRKNAAELAANAAQASGASHTADWESAAVTSSAPSSVDSLLRYSPPLPSPPLLRPNSQSLPPSPSPPLFPHLLLTHTSFPSHPPSHPTHTTHTIGPLPACRSVLAHIEPPAWAATSQSVAHFPAASLAAFPLADFLRLHDHGLLEAARSCGNRLKEAEASPRCPRMIICLDGSVVHDSAHTLCPFSLPPPPPILSPPYSRIHLNRSLSHSYNHTHIHYIHASMPAHSHKFVNSFT